MKIKIFSIFIDMKFEKIRVLGKGSYGVVYLIKDLNTNEKYALKKISYTNG